MIIFSIKNEKLDFFNRPMYYETSNECLAYLTNVLMSDADRALHGLKSDLALYELGEIDFVSGKINTPKKPLKVCDLLEIFNSIPSDSIPQTANALRDRIAKLESEVFCKNACSE